MSSLLDLPSGRRGDRPPPVQLIAPLPLDLLDAGADPARYAGRAAVRAAVLAMMPMDGREPLLPGPQRASSGATWAVRADNGLTLALRARSFPTAVAARRDAIDILARSADFELVPVQSPQTSAMSFWVLLAGRVVLVAGQSWRQPGKSTARQFLRTLGRLPRA